MSLYARRREAEGRSGWVEGRRGTTENGGRVSTRDAVTRTTKKTGGNGIYDKFGQEGEQRGKQMREEQKGGKGRRGEEQKRGKGRRRGQREKISGERRCWLEGRLR